MLKKLGLFLACGLLLIPFVSQAASSSMKTKLNGKILLQVQSRGEAWYVNPADSKRYFLGSPEVAMGVFSRVGLGIKNEQLMKIPLGFNASNALFGTLEGREDDYDADGIPDEYELALGTGKYFADTDNDGYKDLDELRAGYDPLISNKKLPATDKTLINRLKGRIVLQVESRGQAWYINPVDGRRYYLGTPERALAGMRFFGLGITNGDLVQLPEGSGATGSSSSVVDCGATVIENGTAMQTCFGPRFASCSPARVRTELNLTPLAEGIVGYEYEIIGRKNGACEVKSYFTSNPNPEYLNKNMVCLYDSHKPFTDAAREVFPALTGCSGELKGYLMSDATDASLAPTLDGLASNQCVYSLEREVFICKGTQMIFSSALEAGENGYRLEAGTTLTLPKNKLVSLQVPGNTDLRKMFMLFLDKTGIYTLSEAETSIALQKRAQNIVDERSQ